MWKGGKRCTVAAGSKGEEDMRALGFKPKGTRKPGPKPKAKPGPPVPATSAEIGE